MTSLNTYLSTLLAMRRGLTIHSFLQYFLAHVTVVTAVTVSVKDKLNHSIVGSSIVSLVIDSLSISQKVTKFLYSKSPFSLFRMAQCILFPKHILTGFFHTWMDIG